MAEQSVSDRYAPVYVERSVLDVDAGIRFRVIEVVAFILENRSLAEHSKAVSETARHEELSMVLLCEFYGNMLSEGRTPPAYVHGDIEHSSLDAPH